MAMITIDTIPAELRALPNWVCFNERKEPINPRTGSLASSIDPSTWSDFETALRAAERFRLKGVGFVFTLESKIVGIDLDKCRDPDTGAIEPWAQEIIDAMDSYTEISPSRTGVHILVKGVLPTGRRRKGKIEMYDSGRFFTMTGDCI